MQEYSCFLTVHIKYELLTRDIKYELLTGNIKYELLTGTGLEASF